MNPLSLDNLLTALKPASHPALMRVVENSEVHYLLVFEPPSKDRKKIVPAGPKLDFRNPEDAQNRIIDGLRATGYVDLQAHRQNGRMLAKTDRPPTQGSDMAENIRRLESKISWLKSENQQLQERLAEAKKRLRSKNDVIEDLKKLDQIHRAKMEQFRSSTEEEVDNSRFDDVAEAEEALINRMNDYMVKEAELEQREEDLFVRERKIFEAASRAS